MKKVSPPRSNEQPDWVTPGYVAGRDATPEELAEMERRLAGMTDDDIDLTDAPEITDWSHALPRGHLRPTKKQLTIRLDNDLIAWFKARHPHYQTAMNAVLREHMGRILGAEWEEKIRIEKAKRRARRRTDAA